MFLVVDCCLIVVFVLFVVGGVLLYVVCRVRVLSVVLSCAWLADVCFCSLFTVVCCLLCVVRCLCSLLWFSLAVVRCSMLCAGCCLLFVLCVVC